MPQFDPTFFVSQVFWLVVFFSILFYFMSKTAVPKIADVMERRRKSVEDNLAKARSLKEESDAAIANYEAELLAARDAAQGSIRGAMDKATAEADAKSSALNAEMDAKLAQTEKRVLAEKEKALAEVDENAAELARVALQKLIGGGLIHKATADKAVANVTGE